LLLEMPRIARNWAYLFGVIQPQIANSPNTINFKEDEGKGRFFANWHQRIIERLSGGLTNFCGCFLGDYGGFRGFCAT
jgi:hypothetical protein